MGLKVLRHPIRAKTAAFSSFLSLFIIGAVGEGLASALLLDKMANHLLSAADTTSTVRAGEEDWTGDGDKPGSAKADGSLKDCVLLSYCPITLFFFTTSTSFPFGIISLKYY